MYYIRQKQNLAAQYKYMLYMVIYVYVFLSLDQKMMTKVEVALKFLRTRMIWMT